jgi:hypothetical protein
MVNKIIRQTVFVGARHALPLHPAHNLPHLIVKDHKPPG